MKIAGSILVGLGAVGCAVQPLGPVRVTAPGAIMVTTVTPVPEIVDLPVTVEISNQSGRTLLMPPCGAVVERRVGGNWQPSQGEVCPAVAQRDIEIPDGTTHTRTVHASVRTAEVPGTYRVRVFLRTADRRQVPEDQRTSNSFEVAR